jgi:hypothetical protein
MSLTLKETITSLRAIREAAGYGNYDQAVKILNRERVNPDRGKKEDFTWAQVKIAYRHQRGICPVCNKEMVLIREKLHGDHWDCNLTVEQGLNSQKNCACTHKPCNLHKSTKTPAELSKLRQLNPTMGEEEL